LLDRTGSKTCLVYIPHVGRLLAKQFVLIIIITEQLRCRHHRSVNLAVFWCQLHRVFLTYSLTTHVVLNDLMNFLLTSPKQQPNRSRFHYFDQTRKIQKSPDGAKSYTTTCDKIRRKTFTPNPDLIDHLSDRLILEWIIYPSL
jgi:hypothetical protein